MAQLTAEELFGSTTKEKDLTSPTGVVGSSSLSAEELFGNIAPRHDQTTAAGSYETQTGADFAQSEQVMQGLGVDPNTDIREVPKQQLAQAVAQQTTPQQQPSGVVSGTRAEREAAYRQNKAQQQYRDSILGTTAVPSEQELRTVSGRQTVQEPVVAEDGSVSYITREIGTIREPATTPSLIARKGREAVEVGFGQLLAGKTAFVGGAVRGGLARNVSLVKRQYEYSLKNRGADNAATQYLKRQYDDALIAYAQDEIGTWFENKGKELFDEVADYNRPQSKVGRWFYDVVSTTPQLLQQIGTYAVGGGPVSMATIFSDISGSKYTRMREAGLDAERAMKTAIADASLQSALETLPVGKILKGDGWITATLGEGFTEGLQEYVDKATEIWGMTEGASTAERIRIFKEQFLDTTKDALYSASVGAGTAAGPSYVSDLVNADTTTQRVDPDVATAPKEVVPVKTLQQAKEAAKQPTVEQTPGVEVQPEIAVVGDMNSATVSQGNQRKLADVDEQQRVEVDTQAAQQQFNEAQAAAEETITTQQQVAAQEQQQQEAQYQQNLRQQQFLDFKDTVDSGDFTSLQRASKKVVDQATKADNKEFATALNKVKNVYARFDSRFSENPDVKELGAVLTELESAIATAENVTPEQQYYVDRALTQLGDRFGSIQDSIRRQELAAEQRETASKAQAQEEGPKAKETTEQRTQEPLQQQLEPGRTDAIYRQPGVAPKIPKKDTKRREKRPKRKGEQGVAAVIPPQQQETDVVEFGGERRFDREFKQVQNIIEEGKVKYPARAKTATEVRGAVPSRQERVAKRAATKRRAQKVAETTIREVLPELSPKVPVVVARDTKELQRRYPTVIKEATRKGVDLDTTPGFFDTRTKKIYIPAAAHADVSSVRETIAQQLSNFGVVDLLGQKIRPVISRVTKDMRKDIKKFSKQTGMPVENIESQVLLTKYNMGLDQGLVSRMDELLDAVLEESGLGKVGLSKRDFFERIRLNNLKAAVNRDHYKDFYDLGFGTPQQFNQVEKDSQYLIDQYVGTPKMTFKSRVGAYWGRLSDLFTVDYWADGRTALEEAEKFVAEGGDPLQAMDSAYRAMTALDNKRNILSAIRDFGSPVYDAQQRVIKLKDPESSEQGIHFLFEDLVKQVGEDGLNDWGKWMLAQSMVELKQKHLQRAEDLRKEDAEKNKKEIEDLENINYYGVDEYGRPAPGPELQLESAQAKFKTYSTEDQELFKASLKHWQKLNKELLDVLEASGVVNKEQRESWEREIYVPAYRIQDESFDDTSFGPKLSGKYTQGIYTFGGATHNIANPIDNMFNNYITLIDTAMKNIAKTKALEVAGLVGAVAKSNPMAFNSSKANVVHVRLGGKSKYYEITDPSLYGAIVTANNDVANNILVRILAQSKKIISRGATATPKFVFVSNMLRDTFAAYAVEKDFIPIVDTFIGAAKVLKGDPAFKLAKSLGAVYADADIATGREQEVAKAFDTTYGQKNTKLKQLWRGWGKLRQAMEAGTPVRIFEKRLRRGETQLEAAYNTQEIIAFSRRGKGPIAQLMQSIVPFAQSSIAGNYAWYRAMTGARGKELQQRAWRFMALSYAVGVVNTILNQDEEDYEKIPDYRKYTMAYFYIGDKEVAVPIPHLFGIGYMTGAATVDMFTAAPKAFSTPKEVATDLGKNMLSLITFNNMIPSLTALLLAKGGEDPFTGAPVETAAEKRRLEEDRYDAQTTATAKVIGDAFNISPKKAEALVTQLTGPAIVQSIDAIERNIGVGAEGEKPVTSLSRLLGTDIIRDAALQPDRRVGEFWDKFMKVSQEYNSKKFREKMKEDYELTPREEAITSLYNSMNATVKSLAPKYRAIKRIQNDPELSRNEKLEGMLELQQQIRESIREKLLQIKEMEQDIK